MRILPKNRFGFTLAEVLITLTIIGVVAALTIPTLTNKINNAQLSTQFKVATSIFYNATSEIINDSGDDLTNYFKTGDDVVAAYASKLNVLKNCTSSIFVAECWYPQDDVKSLNGWLHTDQYNDTVDDYRNGSQGLVLTNGMFVFFNNRNNYFFSPTCDASENGIGPGCAMLWIDLNGYKKPNTLGRDIFIFILTKTALIPWGDSTNNNQYCDPATASSWNGMECALRVTSEGGMKY